MVGSSSGGLGFPVVFDVDNDGIMDQVFIDVLGNIDQSVFPHQPMSIHIATLFGDQTSHVYRANDLGERLVGSAGDDLFINGRGMDVFEGGSGLDVVAYAGARSSVSIRQVGEKTFHIDPVSDVLGVDVASNVERLRFFRTLYGENASNETILTAYYQNVLHRAPDAAGFEYWLQEMASGVATPAYLLMHFSESAENQLQVMSAIQNGIEYVEWE